MENDELRDDELEETIEDAELDNEALSEDTDDEEVEEEKDWKAEAIKWQAIARRNKNKQTNQAAPKPTKTEISSNPITREEAVLFAQGYSEEDVDHLNLVAKGAGISLKEAKEHPIFQAYIEKQTAARNAKKAQLGASRGSATKKTPSMVGLSEADHKKMWEERVQGQ